jgi:serine protease inhibitor
MISDCAANAFALRLYEQLLKEKDGSLFFSPISIFSALAMASAGARGRTRRQMASLLGIKPEDSGASGRRPDTLPVGASGTGSDRDGTRRSS